MPQVRVGSGALTRPTAIVRRADDRGWTERRRAARRASTIEPKTVPVISNGPRCPGQVARCRARALGVEAGERRQAREAGLVGLFGERRRRERRRRRPTRAPSTPSSARRSSDTRGLDQRAVLAVDVEPRARRDAARAPKRDLVLREDRRRREGVVEPRQVARRVAVLLEARRPPPSVCRPLAPVIDASPNAVCRRRRARARRRSARSWPLRANDPRTVTTPPPAQPARDRARRRRGACRAISANGWPSGATAPVERAALAVLADEAAGDEQRRAGRRSRRRPAAAPRRARRPAGRSSRRRRDPAAAARGSRRAASTTSRAPARRPIQNVASAPCLRRHVERAPPARLRRGRRDTRLMTPPSAAGP